MIALREQHLHQRASQVVQLFRFAPTSVASPAGVVHAAVAGH